MKMSSAFSSNDTVIERKLDFKCNGCNVRTSPEELSEVYEIDRCTTWISLAEYKVVALQFPDELLCDAPSVASRIEHKIPEVTVFILGDTSYGSCCVDEIGAQHFGAQCVIHYGHACLSPTTRLPVLYVFGRSPLDEEQCLMQICQACPSQELKAVLVYDTVFSHAIDAVYGKLKKVFKQLHLSELLIPDGVVTTAAQEFCSDQTQEKCEQLTQMDCKKQITQTENGSPDVICKCGRVIKIPFDESIDDHSFIFVGSTSSPALISMMMTFNKCPFYSFDPFMSVARRESSGINRALMKRFYLMERVKDASIVGIVVGTLGVAKYRQMIDHLKSLLKNAGKKSYTFAVGKLNPAKLANFAEVDINVLVACPESSLLDQSDFYRPVVSPIEVEIACNPAREWTGDYSTYFSELLPGAALHVSPPEGADCEHAPDVSLISNRVRSLGVRESSETSGLPSSQELMLRSDALTVAGLAQNAGEFLANRSWQGLEQNLGATPVSKAIEGDFGIASSYQHEEQL